MLAVDTETTGIDLRHGAAPFFVSTCDEDGNQRYWEWDVDPLTRKVIVPPGDVDDIRYFLVAHGRDHGREVDRLVRAKAPVGVVRDKVMENGYEPRLVLHNSKFDVAALNVLDRRFGEEWWWEGTDDTLIAGHLLKSNWPHDLTSMATQYLGIDISKYEKALEAAVKQCRTIARRMLPDWAIASTSRSDMPSCKEKSWGMDYWLPRSVYRATRLVSTMIEPNWDHTLRDYSLVDTSITMMLFKVLLPILRERGLEALYRVRMRCPQLAYDMEDRGLTVSKKRLDDLTRRFTLESEQATIKCSDIADKYRYDLQLPRGAVNNNLRTFVFDVLKLEPVYNRKSQSGQPTLDSKNATPHYLSTLAEESDGYQFIKALASRRSRDTALQYMEGYRKFWRSNGIPGWYRLHPSLNPTGTDTLRWSSSNPNEQNISKKEDFNLRLAFGPAPGREWWSFDAKNIELRIPAYRSGEKEMIELFERPDDPPYYGSNHLLNFSKVFLDVWEGELGTVCNDRHCCNGKVVNLDRIGPHCKHKFKSTHYQDTKNGGFCKQYGGQKALTDATFKRKGAYDLLDSAFLGLAKLNSQCVWFAEKYGYIETVPDATVDPNHGYPLLCTRTEYGGILPTVPLNYHVQGTAMWWMMMAMIRVSDFFKRLNNGERFAGKTWPGGYYLVLQVHDELVPDMPSGSKYNREKPWLYNLPIANEVQRLMALGGEGISVPTPVSAEFHQTSWAEGRAVNV